MDGRDCEITDPENGLWTFHQPLAVLRAQIGCRMTVVRLPDASLLVHSPIRLTSAIERQLADSGPVRHVVAPNPDHYLYVPDYAAAYPDATIYAEDGVAEKLPGLDPAPIAPDPADHDWADTLDHARFRSSAVFGEVVFLHRSTETLISCDLAFNIQSSPNLLSKALLVLNDSYRSFGPSRACRRLIQDRGMARRDLDAISTWDFDRMILAHGDIVFGGARERLRAAYTWLTA